MTYLCTFDPEGIYENTTFTASDLIENYAMSNDGPESADTVRHVQSLPEGDAVLFITDAWELNVVPVN